VDVVLFPLLARLLRQLMLWPIIVFCYVEESNMRRLIEFFISVLIVVFTVNLIVFTVNLVLSAQTLPIATYNDDLAWDITVTDSQRLGFVQQFKMDGQPATFIDIPGLAAPTVTSNTPTAMTTYRLPVSSTLSLGVHKLELRACATAASGTGLDCSEPVVFNFELRTIAPPVSNAPGAPKNLRFIPRVGGGGNE
jgi:hypothetical protein